MTNDWGLDLLKPRSSEPSRRNDAQSPPRQLVLPLIHSQPSSGSPNLSPNPTLSTFLTHLSTNTHPFGLRSTLLYPLPVYPLIIFLNLILRLTWSIKLSSHLHSHSSEGSVVIFWLEMAEMVRRWMWVFVRVEWEVVKKTREGRRGRPMGDWHEHERIHASYEGEEFELLEPGRDGHE